MGPETAACPTVELAWSLSALTVPGCGDIDEKLAEVIAARLESSYRAASGLFAHWPAGTPSPWIRRHVACYADLVYPIQAFAYYYQRTAARRWLDMAARCAEA